ncbi:MAG: GlcG/HbpS family heme-binding protein [Actinomycetota bacterium]
MSDGVVRVPSVGLDLALRILDGVRVAAQERGVALAATVVDAGGNVVASIRMDGAQLVAAPLAADKAWTAMAAGAPTERWAEMTNPGGSDWGLSTAIGGRFIVFPGGLPIRVDGELVGGLGVSGAAGSVDRACGEAGLAAAGLAV